MDILIVSPSQPELSTSSEIARVASGNRAQILDGYVDRARLGEMLSAQQFEIIHFAGHSADYVLSLSDGPLTADELQTMLCKQRKLRAIILNSCLTAGTAADLHNILNLPIVMYPGSAEDKPALRYAEALYSSLKAALPLNEAHERAKSALRHAFPSLLESALPVLINGTMIELPHFQAEVLRRLELLESRISALEVLIENLSEPKSWIDYVLGLSIAGIFLLAAIDLLMHAF